MTIKPTPEMEQAFEDAAWENPTKLGGAEFANTGAGLAAALAIVERDYDISRRPTPEEVKERAERIAEHSPRRRLLSCIKEWPACDTGEYNPTCCRFPKSCSATVYPDGTADDLLEPLWNAASPKASGVDRG